MLLALPLACLMLSPLPAPAQQTRLAVAVPALPAGAVDAGVLPGATELDATVYLAPSLARIAALDAFLVAQGQKSSPSYHQWLTPAEFGARFGADAAQIAAVRAFVESQGLRVTSVTASGVRMTVHGTATQMESAFAPALHAYTAGSVSGFANTAVPAIPPGLTASVRAIGGLHTIAAASSTLLADGVAATSADMTADFADAVSANTARVLALTTSACTENTSPADAGVFSLFAREAAAQGITVLAAATCSDGGTVSFASTLAEVTLVALAPGLTQAAVSAAQVARPPWQVAPGMPQGVARETPDFTVASLSALASTVQNILASMPASATGEPARLGNMNAGIYSIASMPGLFTQPDGATPGTWEPRTGLGNISLDKLNGYYPRGVNSVNVSLTSSNYSPTHGAQIRLTSTVTDTSGKTNGAVATGTVTFTDANNNVLGGGPVTLVNGTATVAINTLPAGSVTVSASYSGDANYASANAIPITFSVQPEAATFTATVAGSTQLGNNIQVTVTLVSPSGIGTPTGTVYAQLQGVTGAGTESATLSGSNGTATAILLVPAILAGNDTINVTCRPIDPSFTCYPTLTPSAVVTQGTSSTSLNVNPYPVGTGQEVFTATVTGAAAPAPTPTGNVAFYDNGNFVGNQQLNNGVATYTAASLPTSATHTLTAKYTGDNNYAASTSTGVNGGTTVATTTTSLAVNPTSPVSGSLATLTATIANGGSAATPTGNVTFFEDNTAIGTQSVNAAGVATFTSTTISGTTVHGFYAIYQGDSLNGGSQSPTVTTTAAGTGTVATATTISLGTATPTQGTPTTITATVTVTGTAKATAPTGTVNFYSSSTQGLLGTATLMGTTATAAVTFTVAGAQNVYATYVGDTNYTASSSAPTAITVGASAGTSATTTTVVFQQYAAYVGAGVQITAQIVITGASKNAAPTGTVTFTDAVQGYLGSTGLAGSSYASIFAIFNTAGPHTVTATYSGDANYSGSTGQGTDTILPASTVATTTTIQFSTATPTQGVPVTITSTVVNAGATQATMPTGIVEYTDSLQGLLGYGTINGSTAQLSATFNTAGAHTVTATYLGNSIYSGSAANGTVTVAAGTTNTTSTTTTLNVATSTPTVGVATTFTATVASTVAGKTTSPTGAVNFYSSISGLLGSAILNGSTATLSAAFATAGAQNVYATYVGDTNYTASSSTPISITVAGAAGTGTATTTTVSLGSTTPTVGVATTVSATVASTVAGKPNSPGGSVNFYDSVQGFLGTATLTGTTATLPVTFTTAGAQNVYATYAGDTNFTTSTSANVAVTVAASTGSGPTQSIAISPASPVPYGSPVVVTVGLTGITLTSGTAPSGTETLTIAPTGAVINSSVAIVATTATSGTATFTFTAPAPGTYTLTATCTGTNFTCPAAGVTQMLVVVKGNTTTTVTASPGTVVQGTATLLTATIAPVAPSTGTNFTGLVTFYDNGVSLGTGTVAGNTASLSSTLNSTTANIITAVYSGDTNWNTSTSTGVSLVTSTTVTTGVLTVNLNRALYTSNIVFTVNIGVTPSGTGTNPGTAYGQVTFYDLYNGQNTTLGTGNLVSSGAYVSTAQLSTTGLLPGTHSITAIFPANSTFAGVTSNAVIVNITDYGLSFNPPTLVIKQGSAASTTLTVNAINGFAGTVVLGCTPPSGTATTCSFNPAVISANGTSTLTISTTAPQARRTLAAGLGLTGVGVSAAALFGMLLWPRRRRPALLALIAMLGVIGAAGCTNIRDTGGNAVTTGGTGGTPLGTQLFTITTSGTDGVTTNRHDTQLQVVVQ